MTGDERIYRLEGETPVQCDILTMMSELKKHGGYQKVAAQAVGDIYVSTIFLMVDHNWLKRGPPILFETMAFDKDGKPLRQQRYSTYDEARAGHEAICKELDNGQSDAGQVHQ